MTTVGFLRKIIGKFSSLGHLAAFMLAAGLFCFRAILARPLAGSDLAKR